MCKWKCVENISDNGARRVLGWLQVKSQVQAVWLLSLLFPTQLLSLLQVICDLVDARKELARQKGDPLWCAPYAHPVGASSCTLDPACVRMRGWVQCVLVQCGCVVMHAATLRLHS